MMLTARLFIAQDAPGAGRLPLFISLFEVCVTYYGLLAGSSSQAPGRTPHLVTQ